MALLTLADLQAADYKKAEFFAGYIDTIIGDHLEDPNNPGLSYPLQRWKSLKDGTTDLQFIWDFALGNITISDSFPNPAWQSQGQFQGTSYYDMRANSGLTFPSPDNALFTANVIDLFLYQIPLGRAHTKIGEIIVPNFGETSNTLTEEQLQKAQNLIQFNGIYAIYHNVAAALAYTDPQQPASSQIQPLGGPAGHQPVENTENILKEVLGSDIYDSFLNTNFSQYIMDAKAAGSSGTTNAAVASLTVGDLQVTVTYLDFLAFIHKYPQVFALGGHREAIVEKLVSGGTTLIGTDADSEQLLQDLNLLPSDIGDIYYGGEAQFGTHYVMDFYNLLQEADVNRPDSAVALLREDYVKSNNDANFIGIDVKINGEYNADQSLFDQSPKMELLPGTQLIVEKRGIGRHAFYNKVHVLDNSGDIIEEGYLDSRALRQFKNLNIPSDQIKKLCGRIGPELPVVEVPEPDSNASSERWWKKKACEPFLNTKTNEYWITLEYSLLGFEEDLEGGEDLVAQGIITQEELEDLNQEDIGLPSDQGDFPGSEPGPTDAELNKSMEISSMKERARGQGVKKLLQYYGRNYSAAVVERLKTVAIVEKSHSSERASDKNVQILVQMPQTHFEAQWTAVPSFARPSRADYHNLVTINSDSAPIQGLVQVVTSELQGKIKKLNKHLEEFQKRIKSYDGRINGVTEEDLKRKIDRLNTFKAQIGGFLKLNGYTFRTGNKDILEFGISNDLSKIVYASFSEEPSGSGAVYEWEYLTIGVNCLTEMNKVFSDPRTLTYYLLADRIEEYMKKEQAGSKGIEPVLEFTEYPKATVSPGAPHPGPSGKPATAPVTSGAPTPEPAATSESVTTGEGIQRQKDAAESEAAIAKSEKKAKNRTYSGSDSILDNFKAIAESIDTPEEIFNFVFFRLNLAEYLQRAAVCLINELPVEDVQEAFTTAFLDTLGGERIIEMFTSSRFYQILSEELTHDRAQLVLGLFQQVINDNATAAEKANSIESTLSDLEPDPNTTYSTDAVVADIMAEEFDTDAIEELAEIQEPEDDLETEPGENGETTPETTETTPETDLEALEAEEAALETELEAAEAEIAADLGAPGAGQQPIANAQATVTEGIAEGEAVVAETEETVAEAKETISEIESAANELNEIITGTDWESIASEMLITLITEIGIALAITIIRLLVEFLMKEADDAAEELPQELKDAYEILKGFAYFELITSNIDLTNPSETYKRLSTAPSMEFQKSGYVDDPQAQIKKLIAQMLFDLMTKILANIIKAVMEELLSSCEDRSLEQILKDQELAAAARMKQEQAGQNANWQDAYTSVSDLSPDDLSSLSTEDIFNLNPPRPNRPEPVNNNPGALDLPSLIVDPANFTNHLREVAHELNPSFFLTEDVVGQFNMLLDFLSTILKPSEICSLLSQTSGELVQEMVLKTIQTKKEFNLLHSFIRTTDNVAHYFGLLGKFVNNTFCSSFMNDLSMITVLCERKLTRDLHCQILQEKGLSREECEAILKEENDIKKERLTELQKILATDLSTHLLSKTQPALEACNPDSPLAAIVNDPTVQLAMNTSLDMVFKMISQQFDIEMLGIQSVLIKDDIVPYAGEFARYPELGRDYMKNSVPDEDNPGKMIPVTGSNGETDSAVFFNEDGNPLVDNFPRQDKLIRKVAPKLKSNLTDQNTSNILNEGSIGYGDVVDSPHFVKKIYSSLDNSVTALSVDLESLLTNTSPYESAISTLEEAITGKEDLVAEMEEILEDVAAPVDVGPHTDLLADAKEDLEGLLEELKDKQDQLKTIQDGNAVVEGLMNSPLYNATQDTISDLVEFRMPKYSYLIAENSQLGKKKKPYDYGQIRISKIKPPTPDIDITKDPDEITPDNSFQTISKLDQILEFDIDGTIEMNDTHQFLNFIVDSPSVHKINHKDGITLQDNPESGMTVPQYTFAKILSLSLIDFEDQSGSTIRKKLENNFSFIHPYQLSIKTRDIFKNMSHSRLFNVDQFTKLLFSSQSKWAAERALCKGGNTDNLRDSLLDIESVREMVKEFYRKIACETFTRDASEPHPLNDALRFGMVLLYCRLIIAELIIRSPFFFSQYDTSQTIVDSNIFLTIVITKMKEDGDLFGPGFQTEMYDLAYDFLKKKVEEKVNVNFLSNHIFYDNSRDADKRKYTNFENKEFNLADLDALTWNLNTTNKIKIVSRIAANLGFDATVHTVIEVFAALKNRLQNLALKLLINENIKTMAPNINEILLTKAQLKKDFNPHSAVLASDKIYDLPTKINTLNNLIYGGLVSGISHPNKVAGTATPNDEQVWQFGDLYWSSVAENASKLGFKDVANINLDSTYWKGQESKASMHNMSSFYDFHGELTKLGTRTQNGGFILQRYIKVRLDHSKTFQTPEEDTLYNLVIENFQNAVTEEPYAKIDGSTELYLSHLAFDMGAREILRTIRNFAPESPSTPAAVNEVGENQFEEQGSGQETPFGNGAPPGLDSGIQDAIEAEEVDNTFFISNNKYMNYTLGYFFKEISYGIRTAYVMPHGNMADLTTTTANGNEESPLWGAFPMDTNYFEEDQKIFRATSDLTLMNSEGTIMSLLTNSDEKQAKKMMHERRAYQIKEFVSIRNKAKAKSDLQGWGADGPGREDKLKTLKSIYVIPIHEAYEENSFPNKDSINFHTLNEHFRLGDTPTIQLEFLNKIGLDNDSLKNRLFNNTSYRLISEFILPSKALLNFAMLHQIYFPYDTGYDFDNLLKMSKRAVAQNYKAASEPRDTHGPMMPDEQEYDDFQTNLDKAMSLALDDTVFYEFIKEISPKWIMRHLLKQTDPAMKKAFQIQELMKLDDSKLPLILAFIRPTPIFPPGIPTFGDLETPITIPGIGYTAMNFLNGVEQEVIPAEESPPVGEADAPTAGGAVASGIENPCDPETQTTEEVDT